MHDVAYLQSLRLQFWDEMIRVPKITGSIVAWIVYHLLLARRNADSITNPLFPLSSLAILRAVGIALLTQFDAPNSVAFLSHSSSPSSFPFYVEFVSLPPS